MRAGGEIHGDAPDGSRRMDRVPTALLRSYNHLS